MCVEKKLEKKKQLNNTHDCKKNLENNVMNLKQKLETGRLIRKRQRVKPLDVCFKNKYIYIFTTSIPQLKRLIHGRDISNGISPLLDKNGRRNNTDKFTG